MAGAELASTTSNEPQKWSVSGGASASQKFVSRSRSRRGLRPGSTTSAQPGSMSGSQCWNSGVTRSGQY